MKILVICQHYYPEPFRISDICEALAERGNDVTVVTGTPNYPMGVVYEGYENGKLADEVIGGVKIHRCKTAPRKTGAVNRVINYFSFAIASSRYINKLPSDFDVVFVNQLSPVMMAEAGVRYKRKFGTKLVLYCLDLWPDSLCTGGIKKDSLIYNIFKRISKRIYRAADKILITSKSFADYFSEKFGIDNTEYLPQYAENFFKPELCRKAPNGTVDLMFAGNVGAAQGIDTIIRAAALTEDIPNLRWHIVGDGSELDNCKRLADELSVASVIFHGRQAADKMPEFYSKADIMLVTMIDDPTISLTLPGKVQTYMAAGKPILAAAIGEIEKVLKDAECGICCPPNDGEALAKAAKEIAESGKLNEYGLNAYNYNKNNFSKEKFFDKLENELELLR